MIGEFDQKLMLNTVKQLRQDLSEFNKAYIFTERTIRKFLEEFAPEVQIKHISEDFVAWVFIRFDLNEEKFISFMSQLLKSRTQGGEDLFGWMTPDRIDPEPEAEKLLDRIDLALNYLRMVLQIDLPPELKGAVRTGYSIRNGHWEMRRCIERTMTFAEAAYDLFLRSFLKTPSPVT